MTIDEIQRVFLQADVFFKLLTLVKRYFPEEYSCPLTIGQEVGEFFELFLVVC
jgi:hypothetical protein